MVKLKKIEDIDSHMLWQSEAINHGDWPFYFILRMQYAEYYGRQWAKDCGKYSVEIWAVSPEACREQWKSAADSMGFELAEFENMTDDIKASILLDYGIGARLYYSQSNNMRQELRKARKELPIVDMLFGFKMDCPQNAIGSTGWDLIRGDLLGGLASR